ncbi:MAG: AraC family transcriptional regulator [Sphingobacteriales bacterium]|nr:MAG: AraC family transcriptional regulator [Sphingobacteriales bacterium]
MEILLVLLYSTTIIAAYDLYLLNKISEKGPVTSLVLYSTLFLFAHALFVAIVRSFFTSHLLYLNGSSPFILVYGPLTYFMFQLTRSHNIERWKYIAHLTVPVVFWTLFLAIAPFDSQSEIHFIYRKTLSICALVSFSGYTIYALFSLLRPGSHGRTFMPSMVWIVIIMIFMLAVSLAHNRYKGTYAGKPGLAPLMLNTMIYSLMLGVSLTILFYVRRLRRSRDLKADHENDVNIDEKTQAYSKSSLTSQELKQIAETVKCVMEKDQPFLTPGLSLNDLAKKVKVPAHHLTQTVNVEMRTNFIDYLNGYRVKEACRLLKAKPGLSIDQVAELSGFNSKVSFNRNFQKIMGMTPNIYRKGLLYT